MIDTDTQRVIFLDIETIPNDNEALAQHFESKVEPRGGLTDPVKIEKSLNEKRAAIRNKAGLSWMLGQPCAIAFAVNDSEVHVLLNEGNERQLLEQFMGAMASVCQMGGAQARIPHWVGFDLARFDLPYLYYRCVVNGVQPSVSLRHMERPWSKDISDLRYRLNGGEPHIAGKLPEHCLAMGIDIADDDIDGSQVAEAWANGEHELIRQHAIRDIERTRALWRRINFIDAIEQRQPLRETA